MKRTWPPSLALILLNTNLSKNGDAWSQQQKLTSQKWGLTDGDGLRKVLASDMVSSSMSCDAYDLLCDKMPDRC